MRNCMVPFNLSKGTLDLATLELAFDVELFPTSHRTPSSYCEYPRESSKAPGESSKAPGAFSVFWSLFCFRLIKFLEHCIGDKRIIRLIRKWLNAGIIEETVWGDTDLCGGRLETAVPTAIKHSSNLDGDHGDSNRLICLRETE